MLKFIALYNFNIYLIYSTVSTYSLLSLFISTQYFPILLDMVKPLNESRPHKHIILAEYLVDQQKYFYIISVHMSIAVLLFLTIFLATELYCFVNALHAFGLFKVARYKNYILLFKAF